MAVAALLVAAGSGERLGAVRPKAFVPLAGRPMLEWSLDAVRAAGIEKIVVAAPPDISLGAGVAVVPGGATRSASVRAALAAAPPGDEIVVHDAARPLVTPEHFTATLAALEDADCAIAAAPVTDTIKESRGEEVLRTLDRAGLWAVQTPQAFARDVLERALDRDPGTLAAATDDASLVEAAGGTVRLVAAPRENLKVTTPLDLRLAEMLLAERGALL